MKCLTPRLCQLLSVSTGTTAWSAIHSAKIIWQSVYFDRPQEHIFCSKLLLTLVCDQQESKRYFQNHVISGNSIKKSRIKCLTELKIGLPDWVNAWQDGGMIKSLPFSTKKNNELWLLEVARDFLQCTERAKVSMAWIPRQHIPLQTNWTQMKLLQWAYWLELRFLTWRRSFCRWMAAGLLSIENDSSDDNRVVKCFGRLPSQRHCCKRRC